MTEPTADDLRTATARQLVVLTDATGELRRELREVADMVRPLLDAQQREASARAGLWSRLSGLTVRQVVSGAVALLAGALALPVLLAALSLAWSSPVTLLDYVVRLVDAIPGIDVESTSTDNQGTTAP